MSKLTHALVFLLAVLAPALSYGSDEKPALVYWGSMTFGDRYFNPVLAEIRKNIEVNSFFSTDFERTLHILAETDSRKVLLVTEPADGGEISELLEEHIEKNTNIDKITWLTFDNKTKNYSVLQNGPKSEKLRFIISPDGLFKKSVSKFLNEQLDAKQSNIEVEFAYSAAMAMAFDQVQNEDETEKENWTVGAWAPGVFHAGAEDGLLFMTDKSGVATLETLAKKAAKGELPEGNIRQADPEFISKSSLVLSADGKLNAALILSSLSCGGQDPWEDLNEEPVLPRGLGFIPQAWSVENALHAQAN